MEKDVIKCFCDKCKEEVKGRSFLTKLKVSSETGIGSELIVVKELCLKCLNEFKPKVCDLLCS